MGGVRVFFVKKNGVGGWLGLDWIGLGWGGWGWAGLDLGRGGRVKAVRCLFDSGLGVFPFHVFLLFFVFFVSWSFVFPYLYLSHYRALSYLVCFASVFIAGGVFFALCTHTAGFVC